MSTLQVANIWFESTGNTRIQYLGSNNFSIIANGNTYCTVNSSGMFVNNSIQGAVIAVGAKTDNYTVANLDSGTIITMSNTVSKTVTIPSTVPSGFRIMVTQLGTGSVVIANATGVSLGSRTGAYTSLSQYGTISVYMANSSFAIVDGNI